MIVDNALYHGGKRVALGTDADQSLGSARVPCDPGDFQWIGIHDPSPDELQLIAETFDLHPLAVEDAGDSHQRPKLEHYGDTLFLILKTVRYVDDTEVIETGELMLFVGPDFVVTVRHGQASGLKDVRRDLEARLAPVTATDVDGVPPTLAGERLATRPRGVAPDHPRLELLRHRGLYAHRSWAPDDALHEAATAERVAAVWRATRPLTDWLDDHVGAPEHAR